MKFNQKYHVHKNILISNEAIPWPDFLMIDVANFFN
jgi:hypothetical protein